MQYDSQATLPREHTHTAHTRARRARARTHTRTHARARAHTPTHTHAQKKNSTTLYYCCGTRVANLPMSYSYLHTSEGRATALSLCGCGSVSKWSRRSGAVTVCSRRGHGAYTAQSRCVHALSRHSHGSIKGRFQHLPEYSLIGVLTRLGPVPDRAS